MKVAVASGGSPDYLIDVVADGMIRLLGRSNVHLEYNRWKHEQPIFEQLMVGFAPDSLPLQECDLLVASTRTSVAFIDSYKKTRGGRVAVLDGEDWAIISQEHVAISDVYFKREYMRGTSYESRIKPMSFAAIPEVLGELRLRDVPVMFVAGDAHPDRGRVRDEVLAAGWETRYGMSHHEYMALASRSRIGVNVRGAGWDCYRYWETPYAGALLLSQRLGIVIESDFIPDVEAVFFDSPSECVAIAHELLRDEGRRAAIAQAGTLAIETRHLSTHRAERVINVVLGS